MKHSKRYNGLAEKVEPGKLHAPAEAIAKVRELATAKFDESFDLSFKLNLEAKHTVRDTFVLPHTSGKGKIVLVFARGDAVAAAKEAGADFVGDADLIEKIKGGWYDFDVAITTPDMMKDLAKLGPYLGKRGLMPNPKTGTVTTDVAKAVREFKKGRTEFRADKKGVIGLSVGRMSLTDAQLLENANALFHEVQKRRPTDLKGDYMRSLTFSSTMGPGVRVDFKAMDR